ncbi:MAG TPA: protein kinase [Candidatus Binatia bacterium]|nr:protein kinase [Candidatus Binatia bacterium]
MIGTLLGRYRVLEPLGEGGMGRVFLAEDPALGRRVAVKVLPPEFSQDKDRRERLLHEARAASALNHPNILTIHDLGEADGALYVAMERVEGCTLREWAHGRSRSPSEVLHLLRQALAALGVAHQAGLVHRDLKPENIMVRTDGLLKILDFGLARSVTPGVAARTATLPGTILGTAPYMSPEQVLGQPAGPASDLFSLGSILYELLTGRHPFAANTAVETMHRILHEAPEAPSRVNRALTADFDFVLAKALSKDPTRRHASAHDMDIDLETLECGCGTAAPLDEEGAGPRTLAVLPFKNIGGDPELSYLGVGLADAVITRLSSSPDLIVRATSSIASYHNQPVDPRRVGTELDTSAVLDASFQRFGERFRATARLVETATGRSLWAGKVDLKFDDIFEVQDQVAHGIAEAMTARLQQAPAKGAHSHAPSPQAYALLLKGQEAWRSSSEEGFRRGIALAEEAVRVDPAFADAWGFLGSYYHGLTDAGFDPDPIWFAKADHALAQALSLDPENLQALFARAALRLTRGAKRDAYAGFTAIYGRAPNNPFVPHYFSYLFRLCDMIDVALTASLRGTEIDPSTPWPYWMRIRLLAMSGRLREAREEHEATQARFPSTRGNPEFFMLLFGDQPEELVKRVESEALTPRTGSMMANVALALAKVGRNSDAASYVPRIERYAAVDMDMAADMAALSAHLGDPDAAFRHLDRAVALGNDTLSLYENPIFFAPLFEDKRWGPFLDGVRTRVSQWKQEFRWPPI